MAPSRSRSRSQPTTTSAPNNSTRIRARLTPTTLHIPTSRVHKSWRPLPSSTQDRIRTLLLSISTASQSTHLARVSKTRATTNPSKIPLTPAEHSAAIDALTSKLISRLPKMQFPPSSSTARSRNAASSSSVASAAQDADFDYSATLAQNASLAAQLTEAEQSAKLLRASIRREEKDLKREREELAVLQENYRGSVAVGREEERRLHSLVGGLGVKREEEGKGRRGVEVEGESDEEGLADTALGTARRRKYQKGGRLLSESAVDGDEELKALAAQLRSHLRSMAGNTAGLRDMAKELKKAEAAVAAFAWKGMSKDQYERIVGLA